MDEKEILRHLFRGVRPELKSALYAADIQTVEKFREFAKNLEKGMVSVSQSDEISELKNLVKELLSSQITKTRNDRPRYANVIQQTPERTTDNQPICYYCKKPGHFKSNCQILLSKLNRSPQHQTVFRQSGYQNPHTQNFSNDRQTGYPSNRQVAYNPSRNPNTSESFSSNTQEDWVQYHPPNYSKNTRPNPTSS